MQKDSARSSKLLLLIIWAVILGTLGGLFYQEYNGSETVKSDTAVSSPTPVSGPISYPGSYIAYPQKGIDQHANLPQTGDEDNKNMYRIGLIIVAIALVGVVSMLLYMLLSGGKKDYSGTAVLQQGVGPKKNFGENIFQ